MTVTDAHCHAVRGTGRFFVCDPSGPAPEETAELRIVRFRGIHPWEADKADCAALAALESAVAADRRAGVGETGLDRLKSRTITDSMRLAYRAQLEIAARYGRPVVLHGAKCWGETLKAAKEFAGRIPAFLFHGFSRSGGLLPEIAAMNGFVSIGPAILNDRAENYRRLAAEIPENLLLVESDATDENAGMAPSAADVAFKLAETRGVDHGKLAQTLEANALRFVSALL